MWVPKSKKIASRQSGDVATVGRRLSSEQPRRSAWEWQCGMCTFSNRASFQECEMCSFPRGSRCGETADAVKQETAMGDLKPTGNWGGRNAGKEILAVLRQKPPSSRGEMVAVPKSLGNSSSGAAQEIFALLGHPAAAKLPYTALDMGTLQSGILCGDASSRGWGDFRDCSGQVGDKRDHSDSLASSSTVAGSPSVVSSSFSDCSGQAEELPASQGASAVFIGSWPNASSEQWSSLYPIVGHTAEVAMPSAQTFYDPAVSCYVSHYPEDYGQGYSQAWTCMAPQVYTAPR